MFCLFAKIHEHASKLHVMVRREEAAHTRRQRQFGYPGLVSKVSHVADWSTYTLTSLKMDLDARKNASQL